MLSEIQSGNVVKFNNLKTDIVDSVKDLADCSDFFKSKFCILNLKNYGEWRGYKDGRNISLYRDEDIVGVE